MNTNFKISDDSYDLFISYGRGDDIPFVEKLYDDLSDQGYKVWFDSEKLESNGRSFLQNIRDPLAINQSMRLLLVVGPHASQSEYVRFEWEFALTNCIVVMPLLRMGNEKDEKGLAKASNKDYDWIPMPVKKRTLHAIDFRKERLYEDAFKELLSNLSSPILPLCKLDLVPNRPANFIARDSEVEKIKEIVMGDNYKPGVITSVGKSTAVQGMGGIGKSVLAASVCYDCDVRHSFSDGIFWITVGQQQPELNVTKAVQRLTDDYSINLNSDVDEAKNKLRESLKQKNCLIVLDDVWKQQDIAIFPSDEALRCRLLITTRNKQAVEFLSNNILEIDLLSNVDARRLLAKSASNNERKYTAEEMPWEGDEIIKECGNLPLAVSMAGGMISGGDNKKWQSVLKLLKTADLIEISKKFPDYPYPNLYRVLDASVKALEAESQEEDATRAMRNAYRNYLKLAIFKEDTVIPKSIIELLWRDESFFDSDADNLLDILVARSLIQRNKEDNYTLHDLQLDYLKKTYTEIKELNKDFLEKLGEPLKLTHAYAWNNYIWHLNEAGSIDHAIQLLSNYDWIEAKLTATGNLYDVASDYDLLSAIEDLKLIQKALVLSASVISDNQQQLPHQLYGRLGLLESALCKQLAKQSFATIGKKRSSLKPLHPNLETPELHNLVFKGHTASVKGALIKDNTLISWSDDKTVRSWDILSGKMKNIFEGHAGSINRVWIQENTLISWSDDNTLRSWDIHSGKMKNIFEGHANGVVDSIILGSLIIGWSDDNTLRSWDIHSGKIKNVFEGHTKRINGSMIQKNMLVSWSSDRTLRSWDIFSGKAISIFEGHAFDVLGAIIYENMLISWSADDTLRLWDIHSGKMKNIFEGHRNFIVGALFTNDILLSWSIGGELHSWDLDSGQAKWIFQEKIWEVKGVFILNEKIIIWSIWDLLSIDSFSGKTNQSFKGDDDILNEGALIIGDVIITWHDDNTLQSWDIYSGKRKQVFEGHHDWVNGAIVSFDTLISWSRDNTIRSWQISLKNSKNTFQKKLTSVAKISIQENTLVAWHEDSLSVWDINSGEMKQLFEDSKLSISNIIVQNNILISWGSFDRLLHAWDITSSKKIYTFRGHTFNSKGAIIKDKFLISWSGDDWRVWDINSGKVKRTFKHDTNNILLFDNLIFGWSDKDLYALDCISTKKKMYLGNHTAVIKGAIIENEFLISWSSEEIILWEINSRKVKQVFKCLNCDAEGALIRDKTLFIWNEWLIYSWDIESGKKRRVLKGAYIKGVQAERDTLISWTEKELYVWDISSRKNKRIFHGHLDTIFEASIWEMNVLSWDYEEILVWNLSNGKIIQRFKSQIHIIVGSLLFIVNPVDTIEIYSLPALQNICRYTIDAVISALEVDSKNGKIILGDTSGRIHFLEPVGFHL